MANGNRSIPRGQGKLTQAALISLSVLGIVSLAGELSRQAMYAVDREEMSLEIAQRTETLPSEAPNFGDFIWGSVTGITNVFGVPVRVADESRWKEFFAQAIKLVAESTNRFYCSGKEVSREELARRMGSKLAVVKKLYLDPFGGEVSHVLDILTSADGLTREGAFGKRGPYMVDAGSSRLSLYEWLKARLGVLRLPGELTLEEESQLVTGVLGAGFPPLEFGTNRLKALIKFQELILGVERLIESAGCKFYDSKGEVRKDQLLGAVRSRVSSEGFRRRYLMPVDSSGFGLRGDLAIASELRTVLMEAFAMSESGMLDGVSAPEWHRLREKAAYAVLSNQMVEFSNVWRDVFLRASKSEPLQILTVDCDGSRTNIVAWALDKLGVQLLESNTLEIPWQVERLFKLLGD